MSSANVLRKTRKEVEESKQAKADISRELTTKSDFIGRSFFARNQQNHPTNFSSDQRT